MEVVAIADIYEGEEVRPNVFLQSLSFSLS